MDCFFPCRPLKLIFKPCWKGLKLVAVWEAEKKHPSIRKYVGRQVKGFKGRKGWKVKEAPQRKYSEGCALHSRALAWLWWRVSPAVVLFHVKLRQVVHHNSLIWSNPAAINDDDHCCVLSFLPCYKPLWRDISGLIWSQVLCCPVYFALKDLCPVESPTRVLAEVVEVSLGRGSGGSHLKALTAAALTLALSVYTLIRFGVSFLCCVVVPWSPPLLKLRSGKNTGCISASLQWFHYFFTFRANRLIYEW